MLEVWTWHNLPVGQEAHVDANSGDHSTLYPIQKLWFSRKGPQSTHFTFFVHAPQHLVWNHFERGLHIWWLLKLPLPAPLSHDRAPRICENILKWSQMTLGRIPVRPMKGQTYVRKTHDAWPNHQKLFEQILRLSSELPKVPPMLPNNHQRMTKE